MKAQNLKKLHGNRPCELPSEMGPAKSWTLSLLLELQPGYWFANVYGCWSLKRLMVTHNLFGWPKPYLKSCIVIVPRIITNLLKHSSCISCYSNQRRQIHTDECSSASQSACDLYWISGTRKGKYTPLYIKERWNSILTSRFRRYSHRTRIGRR